MKRLMSSCVRLIRSARNVPIITFMAGAFLSFALDEILTSTAQRHIWLLFILVDVFVIYAIIAIYGIQYRVKSYMDVHPCVALTAYGEDEVDKFLARATDLVKFAKVRIDVVGGYIPSQNWSLQVLMPATRPAYLKVIEDVVQ